MACSGHRWKPPPGAATHPCPDSRWEGRVLPPDFNPTVVHQDVILLEEQILVCGTLRKPQAYSMVMTHLPTHSWAASWHTLEIQQGFRFSPILHRCG